MTTVMLEVWPRRLSKQMGVGHSEIGTLGRTTDA